MTTAEIFSATIGALGFLFGVYALVSTRKKKLAESAQATIDGMSEKLRDVANKVDSHLMRYGEHERNADRLAEDVRKLENAVGMLKVMSDKMWAGVGLKAIDAALQIHSPNPLFKLRDELVTRFVAGTLGREGKIQLRGMLKAMIQDEKEPMRAQAGELARFLEAEVANGITNPAVPVLEKKGD